VKPNINSVEVHPQLSNNSHQVGGMLLGAGSLWPIFRPFTFVKKWAGKKWVHWGWGGSKKYTKKNWIVL
jgi:hypothetical protein